MTRSFLLLRALIIILIFESGGCAKVPKTPFPELKTVPYVDLERYLGKWYEIARYPHSFEEGCYAATAFYKMRSDGNIQVTNQCRMGSIDGELNEAVGLATVSDKDTNAKLLVQFFWPFEGDYWIIHLDTDYQYAIVSEPDRQFLWILSRTPKIDPGTLEVIKEEISRKGFNLDYLIMTPH